MSMKKNCLICFVLLLSMALTGTVCAQNQIRNWEFDEPMDPLDVWLIWTDDNFDSLSIVEDAALSGDNAMKVDFVPGASGSMLVFQAYLELIQGATYTISFMAKADAPRTANVQLQGRATNSWQIYWIETVDLTTEPQTFTFEYTHTGPTLGGTGVFDDDIDLHYNFAGSDIDVYLDHVWMGEGSPPIPIAITSANNPSPPDGAVHTETYATIGWTPGSNAVSHDVYMGDNFDDVNNGTGDTFQGNQTGTFYVAGFTGYAFPDGLVPGTTYYWRIDEINELDPNSPWRGVVWSFKIPSKKAHEPVPGDGSHFIDAENPVLSWTTGLDAAFHTIYFSDNFDDVNDGVDGFPVGSTTYTSGPLEVEKTYFWRVDEFDDTQDTHIGDVWSFTTAKAGGGIRGDYYKGMNFENFVLTRTDPEINFDWGDPGGPDATVGDDNFSCRWTGEVEAAFTETYTFYAAADDGVRLWVNGVQLVDAWIDQGTTEYRGTMDLIAGNTYNVVMEQYENGGGATAYLRWSSPSTPKQIIPQAALAPPIKASSPSPSSGATGTKMTPILRWGAGDFAATHEVYFGTDAETVKNATKASSEYKGPRALGDESYDPGKLAWFTQYFWRVDEVNDLNPDSPWIGNLWSFTTGDFLAVDDFEAYNIGDNEIWFSWHDGLGAGTPGSPEFVPSNGTGSMIGDDTTNSYTEETIVHGGSQSMPYWYDNDKQGINNKYSEAKLTLTAPRDWTEEGVAELSIWFRGYPASTGSFVEAPAGTFTMTGSGTDFWDYADEFHYAYRMLTGVGSIQARVLSMDNTHDWAKAGVMIRETLDPGSVHASMVVTPVSGVSFQRRTIMDDISTSVNSATGTEVAPYWVKIERNIAGNFIGSSSTNGSVWTPLDIPVSITMGSNVYIGLAVTSHDAALTCQAVFTDVTTSGNVTQQWAHQDIGITSNAPEPLYVAVSNSAGIPAVVYHDDPNAATIDTWTEWVIPLQDFADQGIALNNVDSIAIGLGTSGNAAVPGGSGKMYFDDIRLYRPRP
ncbi:MAG: PA14 domain-containing protein [Planctomycetota bacterium]